jgi:L-methionine (R)-S-oxide reductase
MGGEESHGPHNGFRATFWSATNINILRGAVSPEGSNLLVALRELAAAPGPRLERMQCVARALRESGGYRWVGLYDVDRLAGQVINVAWEGQGAPAFPVFPITKGLTGSAITDRKTVNAGDVSADPRYLIAFGTTRSEIIVPVFDEGTAVVGTIDIESDKSNAFDNKTQCLLEQCAEVLRPLWADRS